MLRLCNLIFLLTHAGLVAFLVLFSGSPAYAQRTAPASASPDVEVNLEALEALKNPAEPVSEASPSAGQKTPLADEWSQPVLVPAAPAETPQPAKAVSESDQPVLVPLAPAKAPELAAAAPVANQPAPAGQPNYLEIGGDFQSLTANQGDWAGGYARAEIQSDPSNRWNANVVHEHEFHEDGNYFSVGNTHTFNEDWFSDVTAGYGTSGFFLPHYRFDAFINRKLLEDRRLIATVGVGYDKMHPANVTNQEFISLPGMLMNAGPDVRRTTYSDRSVFFGATYYFPSMWIAQGGARLNSSKPGDIFGPSAFGAVTYGEYKNFFITGRYGIAREAYQLQANNVFGPGNNNIVATQFVNNKFTSHDLSIGLKQWMDTDWGINARGEYYHNPSYDRTGFTVGVFKEF